MTAPVPIDLYAVGGNTLAVNLTLTRADNAGIQQPVNLTGATLWMTVKYRYTDPDPGIVQVTTSAGIVVTNATGGLATATIDATATTGLNVPITLYYDVKVLETSGTLSTPIAGRLFLSAPVTLAA